MRRSIPAWGRVATALGLLVCAYVLAPRPLTTLTVIAFGIGAGLLAAGVRAIGHRRSRPRLGGVLSGVLLLAAGVAVIVCWGTVITVLPVVASSLGVAAAGMALAAALSSRRVGRAVRAALWLAAAAGACVIALRWPDVAAILTAWSFVACVVLAAALLLLPAPERASRGVVSGVGVGLAAVLVAVIVAGGLKLDASSPHPDAFYAWEGEIPSVPGTLLRSEPYDGEVPDGATAVRVLYTTSDVAGHLRVASAVVAIPGEGHGAEAAGGRTILAWQHGTTGVATGCAPSVTGDALSEVGIPGISGAIERGWVVVAADYPGQGASGSFPYLIGVGEGRATLDAVRAVRQLPEADASSRLLLWGHSQGGHATLWAGELAQSYAPELDVVGVAALSSATDPHALATGILARGPSAAASIVFAYVLIPYAAAYPDVALSSVVDPAGHAFTRSAANRCATAPSTLITVASALLLQEDRPLYTLDLEHSAAGARLQENVATADFSAPLFLGQGVDDEVIPIGMQRSLAARLCAESRAVTVREYPGRSHMGVIAPGAPLIGDLYAWGDRVLAGEAPSGCDTGE